MNTLTSEVGEYQSVHTENNFEPELQMLKCGSLSAGKGSLMAGGVSGDDLSDCDEDLESHLDNVFDKLAHGTSSHAGQSEAVSRHQQSQNDDETLYSEGRDFFPVSNIDQNIHNHSKHDELKFYFDNKISGEFLNRNSNDNNDRDSPAIVEQISTDDFFRELEKSFSDQFGNPSLKILYSEQLRRSYSATEALDVANKELVDDQHLMSEYHGFPIDFSLEKKQKHKLAIEKINKHMRQTNVPFKASEKDSDSYLKNIGPPLCRTQVSPEVLQASLSLSKLQHNSAGIVNHNMANETFLDPKSGVKAMKKSKSLDPLMRKSLKHGVGKLKPL